MLFVSLICFISTIFFPGRCTDKRPTEHDLQMEDKLVHYHAHVRKVYRTNTSSLIYLKKKKNKIKIADWFFCARFSLFSIGRQSTIDSLFYKIKIDQKLAAYKMKILIIFNWHNNGRTGRCSMYYLFPLERVIIGSFYGKRRRIAAPQYLHMIRIIQYYNITIVQANWQ